MKNRLIRLLFVPLMLSTLVGCGLIDYYFLPPPEDTAQELYEAGREAMAEKKYYDAVEYFNKLKDRYPFSPYTPAALIALGDAHFLNEDYAEAAAAYEEFETMHPRHEEIPYVLYQLGVSNYKRSESIDKPQDTMHEALETFHVLVANFPDTEYGKEGADYILKCRKRLAEHELFVADFYWRTDQYGAAWKRYMYVLDNFKELPEVQEYANLRAQLSYLEYQKVLSEEERMQIEGSWKLWFRSWL